MEITPGQHVSPPAPEVERTRAPLSTDERVERLEAQVRLITDRISEAEKDLQAYMRRRGPAPVKPGASILQKINDLLTASPTGAVTFAELRHGNGAHQSRVNKNALADAIEVGCKTGQFRRGTIITGQPGRPPQILCRGDRPEPTRYDIYRIEWEKR